MFFHARVIHMKIKRIAFGAAFVLAAVAAQVAQATPVNWTFSGTGSFNRPLSGTFTFDADTSTYSNAQMRFSFSTLTFGLIESDANGLSYGILNNTGVVKLTFASPLTNAGGSIAVNVASLEFGTPVNHTGILTAPTTSVASPAPEAGSLAMAGMGLLWAGIAFRRAQARKG